MEIKIPPTITARYEEGEWSDDDVNTLPGAVVLEFGGRLIAEIPVNNRQHSQLTLGHLAYDAERHREEALCEIVADWLGERLQ